MSDAADADPPVLLAATSEGGWETLRLTAETLDGFGVGWHRAENAADPAAPDGPERQREWRAVVVASADGALPGRYAKVAGRLTIRVPAEENGRSGLDLLRDEAGQLPAGPEGGVFATMAIGAAGAKNAALFLVAVFARKDEGLRSQWQAFRQKQTADVLAGAGLEGRMKDEG